MKFVFLVILLVVARRYLCLDDSMRIGVFFNTVAPQSQLPLKHIISEKNNIDREAYFTTVVQQISGTDSFEASKRLCRILNEDEGVAAIFGDESPTTSAILESICTTFKIPYIVTSRRPPLTKQSATVLNYFPEAERYARGLAEIVKSLNWRSFVVIYETEEGLIRLHEVLQLQQFTENGKQNSILVKQLGPGPDHRALLKEIRNSAIDNIVLDCRAEYIIPILLQAKDVGMLELRNRYFLTSLDAHTVDYSVLDTTANITAISLFDYINDEYFKHTVHAWELTEFDENNRSLRLAPNMIETETALFHDALLLLTDTINSLSILPGIETNRVSCNGSVISQDGVTIAAYMKAKLTSRALTKPISFDLYGNRIDFNIYVVDVLGDFLMATWFANNDSLVRTRNEIETTQAVMTNLQKVLVIVSSRLQAPYLMRRKPTHEGEELIGNARYEGYSMDLIASIADIARFKFEFRLTEDGQYGHWDESKRKWTGLVGDILEKKAHVAVCDLTITPRRSEVVDFSTPFMTLGISILHKKEQKEDASMFAFLRPFDASTWIYTATLYSIISVVFYIISRISPGDWEKPHLCDESPKEVENIWDLRNSFWLTLGGLLMQGCDMLPKGLSSRIAISVWWFFSLILASFYIAHLAAFSSSGRMEHGIDGADDLAKQTAIKYGTVAGGSTQAFFRNSHHSLYQRMWANMESIKPSVFVKSNDEGVQRVQTTHNGMYAFLMESTQIEYETATKCDLRQVGTWLDTKSYGIAMPMDAPYKDEINRAILRLKENGTLVQLKKKWWGQMRNEPLCTDVDAEEDGAYLSLVHVGGVFVVLGVGIGVAFVTAIIEFLWNVRHISIDEHMTYRETVKEELKFACNFWITERRAKPLMSDSNSSRSDKSDKTADKHSI